jgi:hypothetical protein
VSLFIGRQGEQFPKSCPTLLAPELVEMILDGKQPATLQLQPLMRGFPVEWKSSARCLGDRSR